MADEIAAMTSVTGPAAGGHGRGLAIGGTQTAVAVMTNRATIMDLVVSGIDRHCGGGAGGGGMAGIAVCRVPHSAAMVGVGMGGEICTVTCLADASAGRHRRSLAIGCTEGSIHVMTGRACVMDLVVGRINRSTCGGAGNGSGQMTETTVNRINNSGGVVGNGMVREVVTMAGRTGAATIVAANTTVRHGNGKTISRFENSAGLMTDRASIVYLVVHGGDRYTA